MHVFYNLVFVATLAIAVPEYHDTLNLGDTNDFLVERSENPSGQIENNPSTSGEGSSPDSDLTEANLFPTTDQTTGPSELTSFNVPDTGSVDDTIHLSSQNIAATLKHDEPGESIDNLDRLAPPAIEEPGIPDLADTSKCSELIGECIPDQTPFLDKTNRKGVNCETTSNKLVGPCRLCNAQSECALLSWKCPGKSAEMPRVPDAVNAYEHCRLCIRFWTSPENVRCSGEVGKINWNPSESSSPGSVENAGNHLFSRDVSWDIASSLNFEEPEETQDDTILNPPPPAPALLPIFDTSKCVELKGDCLPDQKPFRNLQKLQTPRGISCNLANNMLVHCKNCNEQEQCASMSFKCPSQDGEAPFVFADLEGQYRECQLCIDFWTSDGRCSDVLSKVVWHTYLMSGPLKHPPARNNKTGLRKTQLG